MFGMDYHGGGGGFGAGGGGGGGPGGTPSPTQPRGRRNYDERTVTPVTVKMALAGTPAEDGDSMVLPDGRKVNQVCIVGATRGWDDFSTNVLYQIEDGTGLMEVKSWHDDSESSELAAIRRETLKDHVYLKIIGSIKEYDQKKTLVATFVKPLSTGNELTHHMLSVVYAAEMSKRRHSYDGGAAMMGGVGFGAGPVRSAPGTAFRMDGAGGNLDGVVLEFIRTQGELSEAGANVQQCIQALAMQGHSEGAVRKAIDNLNNEGHIYSTIDDNNFKAAM